MKILVIGSGGREHALAWKAAQSPQVQAVYVAPGNAGTNMEDKISNVAIDVNDIEALMDFAVDNAISLTIVGPEAPLVAGIVDSFEARQLTCFGPSAAAAQLEGSKAFTKEFLARYKIPSADYGVFTEVNPAVDYINEKGAPIVVKADGLAAGKGVIIAETEEQAVSVVKDMLAGNRFGEAGSRVVIEEFLQGEEASFICMVDGEHILPLASSQDHKARDDGDKGPNTGGMGAYSPAPVVTEAVHEKIMQQVIMPSVSGMAQDGHPYKGFLYAGLMIDASGNPKVLEYNCRFGDPETQPIMMRLKSDLVELCLKAAAGNLSKVTAEWDERVAVGVVLAAGGYPNSYTKGNKIMDLDRLAENDGVKVFHAGTKQLNGDIVTNGGRVLCVTALGDSVSQAQSRAYERVNAIHWDNVYYRRDIGYRAIDREQKQS